MRDDKLAAQAQDACFAYFDNLPILTVYFAHFDGLFCPFLTVYFAYFDCLFAHFDSLFAHFDGLFDHFDGLFAHFNGLFAQFNDLRRESRLSCRGSMCLRSSSAS